MKRKSFASIKLLLMSLLGLVGLAACNLPGNAGNTTPTLNVTQAYQTVEARLTQVALASPPTATVLPPTATQNAAPTQTSSAVTFTVTPSPKASSTPAVKACDQAEAGTPIDVTIPDDTQMAPGQTFTKVWRLRNSGTCTWSKDYSIAVFSGEAMSAPSTVPLPNRIEPGQSMDVSVDLVAPLTAGAYQGNWKLRNASGTWFGIGPGGSSPFWVRIQVTGNSTITVTPGSATPATLTPVTPTTPNPYPGATNTVNPGVQVSGNNNLAPNDRINLDTNQVNGGGEDLSYQPNAKGKLVLTALGNVGIGGFGGKMPSYADCKGLPLGGSSPAVSNLGAGYFICYRTDQGLYGWMQLGSYNPGTGVLAVRINTWALP
jgi:hypothetical protein